MSRRLSRRRRHRQSPALCEDDHVLGERIRQRRKDLGLTAQALASDAGISAAQISQIERGHSDPSLESLRRIAKSLAIPLFDLFTDQENETVKVVREDRRMKIRSPHGEIMYQRISPAGGRLEMLAGELAPGGHSSQKPWSHAPSEECVLVTQGELTLEVDGEDHLLAAGDSAYFASSRPHRFLNRTKETVRFILSVSPPSY
ncbi:cupin domain-containing protein [Galactobacter sp.]|uniref:helix-turn-helix domain-containing protein n=1 Tax=Galactobacter sp. TaxID=2676125 RepID=UPI0025BF5ED4|nr:cupin domain-containing protein [Galactobacter sp.]